MGEARAALRGLLRALQRYTPNNGDFRTRVVNEFRTNAALTAEEAKPGIALAKDYTFLLHSVNGHLVGTCARSLACSTDRPSGSLPPSLLPDPSSEPLRATFPLPGTPRQELLLDMNISTDRASKQRETVKKIARRVGLKTSYPEDEDP